MEKKIKIIAVSLLFMLPVCFAGAQDIQQKQYYTFERIKEVNTWLNSSNGAGLIYNNIGNRLSNIEAYYKTISGDYKNYNQAKEINSFGIGTESYATLNNDKLFLYGKFNYDYTTRKNQTYLGTAIENMVINPLMDSIPGKNILETYSLDAKVGYKFSNLIGGGIFFSYDAATAAKRIDGRNSNTYSNLVVSPGINFTTEYINAGINFNYRNTVDEAKYRFYGEIKDKYLSTMEGLYMMINYPASSTSEEKRRYQQNYYGGSVQLELKLNNLSFYNNFSAGYGKEDDYEGPEIKKRFAYINSTDIIYNAVLKYKGECMDNSILFNYNRREDLSYNIINNFELIPGTVNEWEYFEYGSVLRYSSVMNNISAEYRGFVKKDGNDYFSIVDFNLGFNYMKWDREHKVYPAQYEQQMKQYDFYAMINKDFECGNNLFRVSVNGGYSYGDGNPLSATNALETGSLKMNKNILATEYAYLLSSNYRVGASLKYSYILDNTKGTSINLGLSYLYKKVTKVNTQVYDVLPMFNKFDNDHRNNLNVTLSYNF